MANKVIVLDVGKESSSHITYSISAYNGSTIGDFTSSDFSIPTLNHEDDIYNAVVAEAVTLANTSVDDGGLGLTGMTATDVIFMNGGFKRITFNTASRSLNSGFQISTDRHAIVNYSVDISCSLSLTSGQQGTVYLEYADDSGFTTGVTEAARCVNGNTGTLTIGLGLTQNATASIGGGIPAGKYVRLRTQNNTGTPTFTYRSGQEILL